MLKMGAMPKQAEDGMRATLERIAALLEPWLPPAAALGVLGLLTRGLAPLTPAAATGGAACLGPLPACTCADPSSDGPV